MASGPFYLLVALLVSLCALGGVLGIGIARRLRTHHGEVWARFGYPPDSWVWVPAQQETKAAQAQWRTFVFLMSRERAELGDARLDLLVRLQVCLVLAVVALMFVLGVMVLASG